MAKKSCWYERIFFGLQLREGRYFKFIILLVCCLVIAQALLTNQLVRRWVVLTERLEGEPVTLYKSSKSNTQNGL